MTAQYGPHRWSAGYHDDGRNDEYRGARFMVRDLRGARFTDCDLTGARIVDAFLVDVRVSGYVDGLVVNGIDVTEYVRAELNRRHPELSQLSGIGSIEDFRAMWRTLEELWADTVRRAGQLPESALHERVDDEWSFVETLRHLVFITDSWMSRTILDDPTPFHVLALPQTAYAPADAAALGMRLDATPTLDEVLEARSDRVARVRRLLQELTNADLGRECERAPAPGYPEESRSVAECLSVVMQEEVEHRLFAVRDLEVLERRGSSPDDS